MPIRIGGGLSGGLAHDAEEHSDNLQGLEKLPQANGGVKAKVTSHMTGNNDPGIEGGIDIKGTAGYEKTDMHKR